MTNATQRVVTALVGLPIVLGALYAGGLVFAIGVALVALLAQLEVYQLLEKAGHHPFKVAGLCLGAVVATRVLWQAHFSMTLVVLLALIGLVLAIPFLKTDQPVIDLSVTLWGIAYPTVLFTVLTDLRTMRTESIDEPGAFWITVSVFLLIWAADIFAYYVGRAVGRHPLFPRVSPKKTWEGFVGGLAGALGMAALLKQLVLTFLSWPTVMAFAVICGVFGPLGDLAESRFKRSAGAKDSGTLLPGHGGVLDRFDAMIIAAPMVYLYLLFFER